MNLRGYLTLDLLPHITKILEGDFLEHLLLESVGLDSKPEKLFCVGKLGAEVTNIELIQPGHVDRQSILPGGLNGRQNLPHRMLDRVPVSAQHLLRNTEISLLAGAGLLGAVVTATGLRHQKTDPVDLVLQALQVIGRNLVNAAFRLRPSKPVIRPKLNVIGLAYNLVPFAL